MRHKDVDVLCEVIAATSGDGGPSSHVARRVQSCLLEASPPSSPSPDYSGYADLHLSPEFPVISEPISEWILITWT